MLYIRTFSSKAFSAGLLAIIIPFGSAQASKEKILYSFNGGDSDGANPLAGLVMDKQGSLYGTTYHGGTNNGGTVFTIAPGGAESLLHDFDGGEEGGAPAAALIMDTKNNLYGTTALGGTSGRPGGNGRGVVFEIKKRIKRGLYKPLFTFTGTPDGDTALARLIQFTLHLGTDGAVKTGELYGTTVYGGAYGHGCVFKLSLKGKEEVLYSFTGGSDGAAPQTGLLIDTKGNLYGTTPSGGAGGYGTVFKITPKGKEAVLHAFTNAGSDGAYPYGDLIVDAKGNFYGTTGGGGVNYDGTVFKITPEGKETVLYSFGGGSDGNIPEAGLIMDRQGNLYGTTYFGGSDGNGGYGYGTIFKLTAKGAETILHAFTGGSDGAFPQATLNMGKTGNLYGTTSEGGAGNLGTVFEVEN